MVLVQMENKSVKASNSSYALQSIVLAQSTQRYKRVMKIFATRRPYFAQSAVFFASNNVRVHLRIGAIAGGIVHVLE